MVESDEDVGGRDCGNVLGDGVDGLFDDGNDRDVGTFWWGGDEDGDGEARVVG